MILKFKIVIYKVIKFYKEKGVDGINLSVWLENASELVTYLSSH